MIKSRFRHDPLDLLRRRLVRETEAALLYGLRFPDRVERIPTVEVARSRFDPAFAARWWAETLGTDRSGFLARDAS
ncbi:MAG: hypothetical protein IID35_06680 [Planctomycetes bacterium]|nr:hypothetical protein [Planctomycetota bacterium]MCH7632091.1 hypothetical protein [Planctomycetota bacterium]